MQNLGQRLELARSDNAELEMLITEYMPFIKKEIGKPNGLDIEYDDRLSLGMLTFMNCVRQYDGERGGFISFAGTCIRNRLIDESRKNRRGHETIIPLFDEETEFSDSPENRASIAEYNKDQERQALTEEIDALSEKLRPFGIDYGQLARICPKQERSRKQCMELAAELIHDDEMRENFDKHGRLPQAELARRFGISQKTVEKHRKYIVALAVIMSGDYPGITAFLPQYKEVRQK